MPAWVYDLVFFSYFAGYCRGVSPELMCDRKRFISSQRQCEASQRSAIGDWWLAIEARVNKLQVSYSIVAGLCNNPGTNSVWSGQVISNRPPGGTWPNHCLWQYLSICQLTLAPFLPKIFFFFFVHIFYMISKLPDTVQAKKKDGKGEAQDQFFNP